MAKILITGSAGFMGSHLMDYLLLQGHDVYGIDNLSIGLESNVSDIAKGRNRYIDLRDAKDVKEFVDEIKPEIVYHLAAWAHEGLSQFMPILITENNYNAFLNLVVPCINNKVKRLVVCSSMSVYGAQTPPFNEDMPTAPEDVYAVAKDSMETTTKILADVHGFEYVIIRPHNVYGPRQSLHDPYRNVAGIFINRLLKGQAPIVYGDGKQTRAFTYIDDVTPYLAASGFEAKAIGQIINIGPTEEYTVNHLAQSVLGAFASQLTPLHLPDRPREVKHAFCTNDRAVEILGYRTSTSLEDGIGRMVEWAKTLGPQEFKYLDQLELTGDKIPETWLKKIM